MDCTSTLALWWLLIVCIFSPTHARQTSLSSELNKKCITVSECKNIYSVQRYFCARNRTCQCMQQYVPNAKNDRCVGLVSANCKYDEHCVDGAYCKDNQKCQCKEDMVFNEETNTCFSGALMGTSNYRILVMLTLLVWIIL